VNQKLLFYWMKVKNLENCEIRKKLSFLLILVKLDGIEDNSIVLDESGAHSIRSNSFKRGQ
jgi:hypothetical protein